MIFQSLDVLNSLIVGNLGDSLVEDVPLYQQLHVRPQLFPQNKILCGFPSGSFFCIFKVVEQWFSISVTPPSQGGL